MNTKLKYKKKTYRPEESAKPAQWEVFGTKMRQTFAKRSTGLGRGGQLDYPFAAIGKGTI
ncbi:hypothetical protein HDF08_000051 [Edaphobacter lichenicola]|uniref:Uncharacterized protein n=1 Tax=Tunturiibacter lichenicola TaxID=2051959 RepID=A0A852VBZ3_9BACT|nr:hypothetical protein [Edaphobacter lichenicola]